MTIDVSTWGWPQWVIVAGWGVSLVAFAILNGDERSNTKYSFPIKFMDVVFAAIILSFGGFFA